MLYRILALGLGLSVAACNGGRTESAGNNDAGDSVIAMGQSPALVEVSESRAGEAYRQEILSPTTGDTVVVQVMEPTQLDTGATYPLVLQGHGYGGSRNLEPSNFQQRLRDAGYYVISIDQRGFGESSGQVRVMDPEYEGQNLIAVLDWAENLPGLRRRANGEMYVGSYGSSYGGMYQFLLHAVDPRHRLRVMAPDITPHDLTYSLNPHNVVKSSWGLLLVAGGEASGVTSLLTGDPTTLLPELLELASQGVTAQDPAILEILLNAGVSNAFSEAGFNFMRYHSVKYFCDGEAAGPQDFLFATADELSVAPDLPPPADILISQGFLDTLFNFNEGLANYECRKAIGGDVRLVTHQSGHLLPALGLEEPFDPLAQVVTIPELQGAGGSADCGTYSQEDMRFAWFEEKLQGREGVIAANLPPSDKICLSLGEGDAILVDDVQHGGTTFDIDSSTPQLNAVLGVAGAVLGNGAREALLANQPLMSVGDEGGVLAGIPKLDIQIDGLSGLEMSECAVATAPVQLGCDPILYLAIGHRPAGQNHWDPLDGQITPVRGFGAHQLEMNGIAERLNPGDELALLIYGFHAQFPITWSRDLLVPAVTLSGTLELPLL